MIGKSSSEAAHIIGILTGDTRVSYIPTGFSHKVFYNLRSTHAISGVREVCEVCKLS